MELIVLIWIVIVVIVWVAIRKKWFKPKGIKIDNVCLNKCQKCNQGEIEPVFKWWRYFLNVGLPPGIIYIIGKPTKYKCSFCGDENTPPQDSKLLTRVSLTHKLPKMFILAFIVQFIAMIGIIFLLAKYLIV
jgi:hypothetical protein